MSAINTSPSGLNPSSRLPSSPEARLESKVTGILKAAQFCPEAPRQHVFDKVMCLDSSEFDEAIAITNRLMLEQIGVADPLNRLDLLCQRAREGLEITTILKREFAMQPQLSVGDILGNTAIELAAFLGHTKLVDVLLETNPEGVPYVSVLAHALCGRKKDLALHLLGKEESESLSQEYISRLLPIQEAIKADFCDLIPKIIEKGCSPNALDASGFSPIARAALHGNLPAMDTLFASGARFILTNENGEVYGRCGIYDDTPKEALKKLLDRPEAKVFLEKGDFHSQFLEQSIELFSRCAELYPNLETLIDARGRNLWARLELKNYEQLPAFEKGFKALLQRLDINAPNRDGLTVLDLIARGAVSLPMGYFITHGARLSNDPSQAFESFVQMLYNHKRGELANFLPIASDNIEISEPLETLFMCFNENTASEDLQAFMHFVLSKGVTVANAMQGAEEANLKKICYEALKTYPIKEVFDEEAKKILFKNACHFRDYPYLESMLDGEFVEIEITENDVIVYGEGLSKTFGHRLYPLIDRAKISKTFGSLSHLSFLINYSPYHFGRIIKNPEYVVMIDESVDQQTYLLGCYGFSTVGELITHKEAKPYLSTDHELSVGSIRRDKMWPPIEPAQRADPIPISTINEWMKGGDEWKKEREVVDLLLKVLSEKEAPFMGTPDPRSAWNEAFSRDLGEILAILQKDENSMHRDVLVAQLPELKGQCVTAWDDLVKGWQDALFKRKESTGEGAFYTGLRDLATDGVRACVEVLKNRYRDDLVGMHMHLPNSVATYLEEDLEIPAVSRLLIDNLHSLHSEEMDVVDDGFFQIFSSEAILHEAQKAVQSDEFFHSLTDSVLNKVPESFMTPQLREVQDEFAHYLQGRNVYDALLNVGVVMLSGETPERAWQRRGIADYILNAFDIEEAQDSEFESVWNVIGAMPLEEILPKTPSEDLKKRLASIHIHVRHLESAEMAVQRTAYANYALFQLEKEPGGATQEYADLVPRSTATVQEGSSPKKVRMASRPSTEELKEFLTELKNGDVGITLERMPAPPNEWIHDLRQDAIREYVESLVENGSVIHPKLHETLSTSAQYALPPAALEKLAAFENIEERLKDAQLFRQKGETLEQVLARAKKEAYQEEFRDQETYKAKEAAIVNFLIEEGILMATECKIFPVEEEALVLIDKHLKNPSKMSWQELKREIRSLS